MKIVAIIEARMTSSRLSGKSMMKILDRPLLGLLIERVMKCKEIDEIIIATTSNDVDNEIEKLAGHQVIATGTTTLTGGVITLTVESFTEYVGTKIPHTKRPLLVGLKGSSAELLDKMEEEENEENF